MRTVIVLSALLDTTWPRRTAGVPVPCSARGVPSPVVVFFARSCLRRRLRAAAFWRRPSRRSSGVAARRRPRFSRAATRRSCGVIGGGAGSAGAAGSAGGAAAAGAAGASAPVARSPLDTSGSVPSAAAAAGPSGAPGDGPAAAARRSAALLGRDRRRVLCRGRLDGGLRRGGARLRGRLFVLLVSHSLSGRFGVEAALAGDRQRACEIALGGAHAGRVLELTRRQLEAQAEGLAPLGADVLDELVVVEVAQLPRRHQTWSSRRTNLVFTGSLCPARRMASRASGSGTPASSNITRPGLTTATQPSGLPLPEPMRVSAGFFVTGLSG